MQMKKKYIVCTGLLISLMFIIISNISFSYADVSSTIWKEAEAAATAGNSIISIIMWVCVAVLVGAVIYKGIKFVTASPDGKAEIKKEIIMIVVGGILIFGIVSILNIVLSLVQSSGLQ
jgi:hypothetical protein